MRTQHRPHFRYARPAAPACRQTRRPTRTVRMPTPVALSVEISPRESVALARGLAVGVPLSLAVWAALLEVILRLF